VTDQQQPRSGSSWEPAPNLSAPGPVPGVAHPPVNPVWYDAAPPPPFRSRWERNRGTVAGVALGLLATGVFGGFALGTVPSPAPPGGQTSQVGTGFAPSHQQPAGGQDGGSRHGDGESTHAAFDS
jgi:hypothetical protein